MKLTYVCAVIGCLPAVALGSPEILLDKELNELDIRAWVIEPQETSAPATSDNLKHLRLTNNHSSAVQCSLRPEPAEDSWTFFPDATIQPGEDAELPIGGDYSTETIRVKLICDDEDLL
ncbi:hypothetical protein [Pseudomonas sp. OIL-1]|uniref:hypothetical protein n=1 Tax=Pseudomonas sp. OIL-1 TaxID=2706126 RepID=UPI0013A76997|nr:hypothetical protein [Pseudomonas sp. OIL-1]QIB51809.1 hypothetical protein G3M63_12570 [Pseudomonas sp. OIL-1]